jgi:hypothetical protein
MHLGTLALTLQTVVAQVPATADTTRPELRNPDGRVPPSIEAKYVNAAPRLDGRLDDDAWQGAMIVADFTQTEPEDGTDPTERTEVCVVYDGGALYIGARLYDTEPLDIARRLGRRDSWTSSDEFEVVIDSYHDHRTAFLFSVNPAGVRGDAVLTNDDHHGDGSWDPVWSVATGVDTLGWVVEMKIPFSQLRFSGAEEQVWGINFTREVFRKSEEVLWSWVPNEEQGYTSHFGHVTGIRGVRAPRRLELLPYTVAQADYVEGADRANPFNDGSVYDAAVGLDLMYGLTSDMTLNATVNPDFGQVEADPAVVNLSAFETYFPERRPFFVEGANIFRFGAGSGGFVFGAPQLFYSRRIGRTPTRYVEAEDGWVRAPEATSILAAAKLSGKTGGWSIGVMDALTAREHAQFQGTDGSRWSEPVEPLANYAVVSLRKDFRGGGSGVGIMGTAVNRDLRDTLFSYVRSSAYTGGADFFHKFAGNEFAFNASLSGSRINGDPEAITDAQRSSARYYQRPDQDYKSLDTTAMSMTGFAGSAQIGKISGNWLYGTDFYAYSPGFEVNDAGFEREADRIFNGWRVTRRWLDPGRVFRQFSANANIASEWNFGGTRVWTGAYAGFDAELHNYWSFGSGFNRWFKSLSDRHTRGGPIMEAPSGWSTYAWVETDHRKTISVELFGDYAANAYGGWGAGGEVGLVLRPAGAMNLSISPGFSKQHAMAQYVTQEEDSLATATYGGRYLFSELLLTTLDITLRADLSITPNLSLQLWAQPFASTGDYVGFKELAEAGTFDFLRYGVDGSSTIEYDEEKNEYTVDPDGPGPAEPIMFGNPDFSVRSLRSNLVIRWEYRPGSTLFLVWNHNRSGESSDPYFDAWGQIKGAFTDASQNTFLIKLNFWISL